MTGKQPPLILHVIHHLVVGGMENGLVNLINGMPPSRFRHAIACVEDFSDFRKRLTRPDVEVIALHRSRVGLWSMRAALFRLCRRLRPAIVHSRNMSGLDALLPARLAGVRRCVHGEHGWDVNDLDGKQWKPALLRRMHTPLIDRYVTVSKDLERYLVERVGVSAERITQIYNGVDTDRFAPLAKRSTAVFPSGFAADDSIVIGTVGRIQAVKDQETLIRAFASLVGTGAAGTERLRLAVVGDGPLLAHLRSVVDSLGISALVWLPGSVSNVPDIVRAVDVFVLPSLAEGISNTILEAMASGVPVVASAVGGNCELVDDGVTGRLFQPRDAQTLTRMLAQYALDPLVRHQHARRAREVAVERYGLPAMINNYQNVYERLDRTQ